MSQRACTWVYVVSASSGRARQAALWRDTLARVNGRERAWLDVKALLALVCVFGCGDGATHIDGAVRTNDAATREDGAAGTAESSSEHISAQSDDTIVDCVWPCCGVVQFPAVDGWPRPAPLPTGTWGNCLPPVE